MINLLRQFELASFKDDYQSARRHFLSSLENISPALRKKHQLFTHPLKGAHGEELVCDFVYLGQTEKPKQLLVLMSATHGVEGFAGSAIQNDVLPLVAELLEQQKTLGVVLIHAFNPWGFSWCRRYDHEGIDLNRNFVDYKQTIPANPAYAKIHSSLFKHEQFSLDTLDAFWQKESLTDFTDTMTHGQYTHPDGCFYGGVKSSWSRQVLEEITADPLLDSAKAIAVIDLHTGLGPYGYGEVINDHQPETTGFQLAKKWYGHNAQSALLGESCSAVKLGLVDYHWHQIIGDRGCFVTLEFGTFSLQQFWLSLLNEQCYQNKLTRNAEYRDPENLHVQQLKTFFYPAEKRWQQQVLFRARQVIDMALEGISR